MDQHLQPLAFGLFCCFALPAKLQHVRYLVRGQPSVMPAIDDHIGSEVAAPEAGSGFEFHG